jgi:hypothetical protein
VTHQEDVPAVGNAASGISAFCGVHWRGSVLTSRFFLKVLLPAAIFAPVTYALLGYTHPAMPLRMRMFFSLIWVAVP